MPDEQDRSSVIEQFHCGNNVVGKIPNPTIVQN